MTIEFSIDVRYAVKFKYTRDISTLERGEFKVESFMATRMCNVCKKIVVHAININIKY